MKEGMVQLMQMEAKRVMLVVFLFVSFSVHSQLSHNEYVSLLDDAVKKENTGDYKGAIADFTKIINSKPADTTSYLHRGLCHFILNNLDDAYQDLTTTIKLDSLNYEAYHGRANVLVMQGKADAGLDDFDKALLINPNFSDAFYNRGYLYFQMDEFDLALKDIEKSLLLNPDDIDAYYVRGLLWQRKKRHQKAIADFDLVIEKNEEYYDAYFERGFSHKESGNYEEALDDFDFLRQRDYYDKMELYKNIAHCHYKLENKDECCFYLNELFKKGYNKKELDDYYKETCSSK